MTRGRASTTVTAMENTAVKHYPAFFLPAICSLQHDIAFKNFLSVFILYTCVLSDSFWVYSTNLIEITFAIHDRDDRSINFVFYTSWANYCSIYPPILISNPSSKQDLTHLFFLRIQHFCPARRTKEKLFCVVIAAVPRFPAYGTGCFRKCRCVYPVSSSVFDSPVNNGAEHSGCF